MQEPILRAILGATPGTGWIPIWKPKLQPKTSRSALLTILGGSLVGVWNDWGYGIAFFSGSEFSNFGVWNLAKIALSAEFKAFSWKFRPLKNIFWTLENGYSIRHQFIPPLSAGRNSWLVTLSESLKSLDWSPFAPFEASCDLMDLDLLDLKATIVGEGGKVVVSPERASVTGPQWLKTVHCNIPSPSRSELPLGTPGLHLQFKNW